MTRLCKEDGKHHPVQIIKWRKMRRSKVTVPMKGFVSASIEMDIVPLFLQKKEDTHESIILFIYIKLYFRFQNA